MAEEDNTFNILILEDEFLMAEDLKNKLHRIGFKNVYASLNSLDANKILNSVKIDFAIVDVSINQKHEGIGFGIKLNSLSIPYIYLTSYANDEIINKAKKNKPAGYLIKPASENDLKTTIEIAKYKAAYESMSRIEKERRFLFELNSAINFVDDNDAFFSTVISSLRPLFELDRPPNIAVLNENKTAFHITVDTTFPSIEPDLIEYIKTGLKKFNPIPRTDRLMEVIERSDPTIYSVDELKLMYINEHAHDLLDNTGIKSCLIIPLKVNEPVGFLNIMSSKSDVFGSAHFDLFKAAANHIAVVLQNNFFISKLNKLKVKAEQEKDYLIDEIETDYNADDFMGNSQNILSIKEKVRQVSKVDTSVLIVGETGTGKELIARYIHKQSGNAEKPMVKINCASLPSQLIESELFGHEKGSFTGANKRVIGKFEMANNGIVFLDEIGELPLDLQPKLLRVIQEKEIVRIGGANPIKLNVKILAATNRDLEEEVQKGNFRADLFYRLNVFPITIPPLRERKEEIPELADFFLRKFSRKLGKNNLKFSESSIARLLHYDWPGNIRELQHVIEREVILSKEKVINLTHFEFRKEAPLNKNELTPSDNFSIKTYKQAEKDLIISTLKHTNGKVRGPNGAAEILDINPSTLESKIRKLKIVKRKVFN
ncbi:MAG: sigma 54-interacting transcriptional regulator [Bacteroidota bacterium]